MSTAMGKIVALALGAEFARSMAWQQIALDRPLKVSIADVGTSAFPMVPMVFTKRAKFDEPMVEFIGRQETQTTLFPPMRFVGDWEGPGVLFSVCENIHVPWISGENLKGVAMDLVTCRQSTFGPSLFSAVRRSGADPVVRMRSLWADKDIGDACNNCEFGRMSIRNCSNDSYLELIGGGKETGLGRIRDITLRGGFFHPTWGKELDRYIPLRYRGEFAYRPRTLLRVKEASNIEIDRLMIRADPVAGDVPVCSLEDIRDSEFGGIVRLAQGRMAMNSDVLTQCDVKTRLRLKLNYSEAV